MSLVLIWACFVRAQSESIFFVDLDSVLKESFLGDELKDFTDSIYNFYYEIFDEDLKEFYQNFVALQECCCSYAYVKSGANRLRLIQDTLRWTERALDTLTSIIEMRHVEFTKSLVSELSATFAASIEEPLLVLDHSSIRVLTFRREEIFLTDYLINEINSGTEVIEQLNKFHRTLSREVKDLIRIPN
ncbi:MAG: hypothetical protein AAGF87_00455 [Bacteroidota bacterium]